MQRKIIILIAALALCLGCYLLYKTLQPKKIQSEIKTNIVRFDTASTAVVINKFKSTRGGEIEVRQSLTKLDDNSIKLEQSIIEPDFKHFGIVGGVSGVGLSIGIAWRPSLDYDVSAQLINNGYIVEGRYWIW